ncbi:MULTISPECIES: ABC transporter permease [Acidithrix]|uniref:ABC-2 family transporter protein n=1 Tax=Acidithrix ferrooxidans TaxID=1280514 RepID=A0A0D8HEZ6_9ACTN|nr:MULTISPECIES: ABC transporter permease [Acidithrix]KJF16540.1 ABC-2 family transporter protein [Acidithrix ferrooxidans]CAG4933251.1 unnamed protein product [Acidithrix sp. C25]
MKLKRPQFGTSSLALIAKREIRQRTNSRAFRIATILTMLAAFAYVLVPHLTASKAGPQSVGIESSAPKSVLEAFQIASTEIGVHIRIETIASSSQLEKEVRSQAISVGYSPSKRFLINSASTSSSSYVLANRTANVLATINAQDQAGLTKSQLYIINHPAPFSITSLTPSKAPNQGAQKAAIFELILMYVLLSQYSSWVMFGIIEEKSTRVIEVLLSIVRPIQLLTGKIAGIAVVALIHATLLILSLIVGLAVIGVSPTSVVSGSLLVTGPIWFIAGYGFYATLFASVGSMVSRVEDAQAVSFPLVLPMLAGYGLGFFEVASSSPSLLAKVLVFIPGVSPFLAPVLFSLGKISLAYFIGSIAVSIIATVLVARIGARIYIASILRIGARVKFSELGPMVLRRSKGHDSKKLHQLPPL